MEIRYINDNDSLEDISAIYEASWKHFYKDIIPDSYLESIPKGRWANSINKEGYNNLLFTVNGKAVGTACFCRSRWDSFADYGEIVSIYFLPEYTRRGYGSMLLKKSVDELRQKGYEQILLWVLEDNTSARLFYEKNGFTANGEYLDDNIGGKPLKEIMYQLK